jgi:hypothetical protein
MIKKIQEWYSNYHFNKEIRSEKSKYIVISEALNFDNELRIYTPKLKIIAQELNDLYYEKPEKMDFRQQFVLLATLRLRDHFTSMIFLIKYQQYQSAVSILRAICELLFLFKYIQKNLGYIDQFMEKTGKGKELKALREAVDDPNLNGMYKELSKFIHPNPFGIKYCYYKLPDSRHILISQIPLDYKKFEKETFEPFIIMMQESTSILNEIKQKNSRSM